MRIFPFGNYFAFSPLHSRSGMLLFTCSAIHSLFSGVVYIMERVYEMTDIGSFVRKKRIELGMTQSQLADSCGKGTRFISDLENGKPTMQIGKVIDILHVLGLDLVISERGKL